MFSKALTSWELRGLLLEDAEDVEDGVACAEVVAPVRTPMRLPKAPLLFELPAPLPTPPKRSEVN